MALELLYEAHAVGLRQGGGAKVEAARIGIVEAAYGVLLVLHGVNAMLDLAHRLGCGHVAEQVLVEHVEVGVEVDNELLVAEGFAVEGLVRVVGHHLRATRLLQVFALLTVPQV